jgi:hypothetical protein
MFEPYPGRTTFTKLSEQANGATSALGRALGYMGFGIDKSIATSNEVLGRQEAADDRNKVISVARPTPVLETRRDAPTSIMGPRSKQLGEARLSAREQTEASQTAPRQQTVASSSGGGGATPNQIKMLTQMCAERGLDFDPETPMTYSEAKDMFLNIKPIPKVK